jgi:hypothetical protein
VATLNNFTLFTVIKVAQPYKGIIVMFPWQQWLCKHATVLHYKPNAYLVIVFIVNADGGDQD